MWSGRANNFTYDSFIEACKDVDNTVCLCRLKKKDDGDPRFHVIGMYTDIPWDDSGNWVKNQAKTFIFMFDDADKLHVYPHIGQAQPEVCHTDS